MTNITTITTPKTIIEYLHHHVATKPDEIAFSFLPTGTSLFSELTFKEFWFEALSVANFLKSKTQNGDKVLLLYPPSLDYVITFYGCLLAGVIAVPIALPQKNASKIVKMVNDSKPVLALTTLNEISTVKAFWRKQEHLVQSLDFFTTNNSVSLLGDLGAVIEIAPRSPAFLHYIAGVAGTEKEVMVTHTEIIENFSHLSSVSTEQTDDVFVGWLPFFHDNDLNAQRA
jgi:acyl-CoA synthetase (AMP-forming)/AMP-acid ligase II